jgi:hypothetical protein
LDQALFNQFATPDCQLHLDNLILGAHLVVALS